MESASRGITSLESAFILISQHGDTLKPYNINSDPKYEQGTHCKLQFLRKIFSPISSLQRAQVSQDKTSYYRLVPVGRLFSTHPFTSNAHREFQFYAEVLVLVPFSKWLKLSPLGIENQK